MRRGKDALQTPTLYELHEEVIAFVFGECLKDTGQQGVLEGRPALNDLIECSLRFTPLIGAEKGCGSKLFQGIPAIWRARIGDTVDCANTACSQYLLDDVIAMNALTGKRAE